MLRTALKILLPLLVVTAVSGAWAVYRSPDARYVLHEIIQPGRFHQYDGLITETATRQGLDPMLIKAVVWRESRFQPGKIGRDGERGLMQLSEAAASDWAGAQKIEPFDPNRLLDPEVNLQAGTWYLKQSLQRWSDHDDPLPFALTEYNAGKKNLDRWLSKQQSEKVTSRDLLTNFSFPNTRSYVQGILARYEFYKKRGRL
jgi:soluble lytic murein transglycosylase